MNKVIFIGRLSKEPELKYTAGKGTPVCTFSMAVKRRIKKEGYPEADFFNVVIYGKQAEATATYMKKGNMIGIEGSFQNRSYDNKAGEKRYITELIANEVEFLQPKGTGTGSNAGESGYSFNDDIVPIDDGDIPF